MRYHGAPALDAAGQSEERTFQLVDAEAARGPDPGPDGLHLVGRPLQHQAEVQVRVRLLDSQRAQDVARVLLIDVRRVQVCDDNDEGSLAHAEAFHVRVPRGVAHEVAGPQAGEPRQRVDRLPELRRLLDRSHERQVRPPRMGRAKNLVEEAFEHRRRPAHAAADHDDVRTGLAVRLPLALTRTLHLVELHQRTHLGGKEVNAHDDGTNDEEPRQRRGRREVAVAHGGYRGEDPIHHLDERNVPHLRRHRLVDENLRVAQDLKGKHRAAEDHDQHQGPQQRHRIAALNFAHIAQTARLLQLLIRMDRVGDPQIREAKPAAEVVRRPEEGGDAREEGDKGRGVQRVLPPELVPHRIDHVCVQKAQAQDLVERPSEVRYKVNIRPVDPLRREPQRQDHLDHEDTIEHPRISDLRVGLGRAYEPARVAHKSRSMVTTPSDLTNRHDQKHDDGQDKRRHHQQIPRQVRPCDRPAELRMGVLAAHLVTYSRAARLWAAWVPWTDPPAPRREEA
mmetsp:Transcript_86710/g.265366  ORF Transcript_86710/g.265366 Transcript_86710/m.265366 type:complete len:508 (+) Transcript_86710:2216-3739(+)